MKVRHREMKQSSLLKSPKKEETQLVPENYYQNIESLEDIKGFLGLSNNYDAKFDEGGANFYKLEDHSLVNNDNYINNSNCVEHEFFGWDFMNSSSWETYDVFPHHQQQMKDDDESFNTSIGNNHININSSNNNVVKNEELFGSPNGYWDENVMDETKASLNLNLNYEEVLEAWSNRGSLWAHNHHPSFSVSNNHPYMGEVPNLEDERTRRETSVLRYKEKRQSRLFSKKIRYEVRKLNADKRPRLKGRFVKRCCDDNSKVSKAG